MKGIGTILCPVDFTPVSERELVLGAQLAERLGATLVLQHSLPVGGGLGVSWMHEKEHHDADRAKEAAGRARLSEMLAALPPAVRASARGALTYGALHHCVQSLAEQIAADLIVIGTHGRADPDHPSETERLITQAPCPVLTLRDDAPHEWLPALGGGAGAERRINTLVPVDFSDHAVRALRYGLDLAERLPLDVTAVYVSQRADRETDWAELQLAKAVPGRRAAFKLALLHGEPVDTILREEDFLEARLVVMGAHARGLLGRVLSRRTPTAQEVLRASLCPVWFVPASAKL